MVVLKNIVGIIVTFHVPETLEARVNALIKTLHDTHLRHYFVPSNNNKRDPIINTDPYYIEANDTFLSVV